MNFVQTFLENKHAADEKWRDNGNLHTINFIRTLVTVLLLGGLITMYLTFRSGGTSPPWTLATFAIFAALFVVHNIFERLVNTRRTNEKLRNSSKNPN
jgi:hypothetical protein